MDVLHDRCAGLDISKRDAKACVRTPITMRRGSFTTWTTTWGSTTNAVLALRDHLLTAEVTLVVIEATSDYWKPFCYLLGDELHVALVNARQVKNLPGRKTSAPQRSACGEAGECFGSEFLELGERDVAEMLRESPPMAEGVEQLTFSLAPEGVAQRANHGGPGTDGLLPGVIDIVDMQVDGTVGAAEVLRPEGFHLRELVGQHQGEGPDADLDVDQPAAGYHQPGELCGPEGLLVPGGCRVRAASGQVQGVGVERHRCFPSEIRVRPIRARHQSAPTARPIDGPAAGIVRLDRRAPQLLHDRSLSGLRIAQIRRMWDSSMSNAYTVST
jgi:hypothetical protein